MRNTVLKDYKNRRVALRHESDRPECPPPCLIELQVDHTTARWHIGACYGTGITVIALNNSSTITTIHLLNVK